MDEKLRANFYIIFEKGIEAIERYIHDSWLLGEAYEMVFIF
jgi:hypothetical protein